MKATKENIANQKLIAAAPQLLKTCEILLKNFELNKKFETTLSEIEITAGINILTDVIKKATE